MEKLAKRYINIILKPKFSSSQQIIFRLMGPARELKLFRRPLCSYPIPTAVSGAGNTGALCPGSTVRTHGLHRKALWKEPFSPLFAIVSLYLSPVFSFLLNHSSPSCLSPLTPLLPFPYSAHLFGAVALAT